MKVTKYHNNPLNANIVGAKYSRSANIVLSKNNGWLYQGAEASKEALARSVRLLSQEKPKYSSYCGCIWTNARFDKA